MSGVYEVIMSKYDRNFKDKIRSLGKINEEYVKIKERVLKGEEEKNMTDFKIDPEGIMKFKHRICIPNLMDSKLLIFNENQKNISPGHPGYHKMISTLRKQFYWPNVKNDTADYLSKCLECQQVKVEHQHPIGLLHPFPIPE
jgi:hypothetical protein